MRRRRMRRRRAQAFSQPRIRDEMKTVDNTVTSQRFNSANLAANTVLLNQVDQGNTANTRIGKRIVMKAIQIRGKIQVPTSATVLDKVTVLLIYVRNVNSTGTATLPLPTEVLAAGTSSGLTNRDAASKFKILRRWDYIVQGNTTVPTEQSKYIFEEYIVFKKPLVTQWLSGSTTGPYSAMEKGGLILMTLGDAVDGATNPVFSFNCRLYYSESDGYVY